MGADFSVAAIVQAWGPTVVLIALATTIYVLTVALLRRINNPTTVVHTTSGYSISSAATYDALGSALEDASRINSFHVNPKRNPRVYLAQAIRITAVEYQKSIPVLVEKYKEGHTVTVDLRQMEIRQAIRLVDFCSGMVAAHSGWIFRVTDDAFILVPPT